ncbi:MAG TPA: hypothetical protein VMS18_05760 [Candidatus Binatia bacterium]|nr:hypothetical protein [Candidatus Binatia bacterium]
MGNIAARIAVMLCLVVIGLPYLLHRGRLWPHYWAGYIVLGLSFLHAGSVMTAMRRANATGIWAASGALSLLAFEIALGLSLRESAWKERAAVRRIHFWIAVSFVSLLTVHLWLNA